MSNDRPRKLVAGRCAPVPVLALTAWALLVPTLGCYRAVPVAAGATPALGEGTVVLTPAGSSALAQQLGANVREIDGTIQRVTADSLALLVTQTTTLSRERFTQTPRTVTVARSLVEQVRERRLARGRSWALAGAVVAVLTVALRATGTAFSSGEGGTTGPIQP